MRILVTSGGTREPIDSVRVITNIGKGTLGALIAEEAIRQGHEVIYLHTPNAILPKVLSKSACQKICAATVNNVKQELEKIIPTVDACIHSMAVSDYIVDRVSQDGNKVHQDGKISSEHQTMTIHLKRAPKLIQGLKQINPNLVLVGFKLLDHASDEQLAKAAQKTMQKSHCDFVLANDLAQIRSGAAHRGLLFSKDMTHTEAHGKQAIAKLILEQLHG